MNIVPFEDWTRRGRWWPTRALSKPAAAIVIHHSVTTPTSSPRADARKVEEVIYQRRWKSRFSMVAYNWMIHPDGTILEGRGPTYRNGANNNTRGGAISNHNSVSVCFIGDYRTTLLTETQRRAFWWLAQDLERNGTVANSNSVMPHSALSKTTCPAEAYSSLGPPMFNGDAGEEDEEMVTCIDKLSGEAWVCSGTKARKINDVAQWMSTWEGPVRRANNMKFVIDDLYEIV